MADAALAEAWFRCGACRLSKWDSLAPTDPQHSRNHQRDSVSKMTGTRGVGPCEAARSVTSVVAVTDMRYEVWSSTTAASGVVDDGVTSIDMELMI